MAYVESSWLLLLGTLITVTILYVAGLVIYRLYFSPLAQFPGPKLAAATGWYEFYYDIVKDGLFFKKIQNLHEQYGPIVRITPRELHIQDSDFYEKLNSSKLDKDGLFYDCTNLSQSAFGTKEHELHRKRRAALNPYFSRSNIDAQVPLVKQKLQSFCEALQKSAKAGEVVRLDIRLHALTMDVVTQCVFGQSYGAIENPQIGVEVFETFQLAQKSNHINRCFPIIAKLLNAIPPAFLVSAVPRLKGVVEWKSSVETRVSDIMRDITTYTDVKSETKAKPTIYHQILNSNLPPEELTFRRLTEDGTAIVFAGLSTTGWALTITSFHLIRQPSTLAAMRAELDPLIASSASGFPTYTELEALPFLTAIVKEGIRLSWGTSSRLPRLNRSPIQYGTYTIPPGTSVGMNTNDVLMDPEIFIEPEKFNPNRWLEGDGKSKALDKYFVAFARGPRSCPGLWLAYSEIYGALAAVFSRFDLELFGSDEKSIAHERDYFTPYPNAEDEGVKVTVKTRSI